MTFARIINFKSIVDEYKIFAEKLSDAVAETACCAAKRGIYITMISFRSLTSSVVLL